MQTPAKQLAPAARRRGFWYFVGTLFGLSMTACGGGDANVGLSSGAPMTLPFPAPALPPAEPGAQPLAGVWSDPAGTVLMVTSEGLAYGLLSTYSDTEIVRGTLLGQNNLVETSNFDAASLRYGASARQVSLAGQYQPASRIELRLIPGDGTLISMGYDAGHEQHTPLADQAGSFSATVYSEGFSGDYALILSGEGDIGLTSLSKPHCQAHGALGLRQSSPGLTDLSLTFAGDECMLPSGTVIQGLAIFDPAIRLFSAVGMDTAGGIGLFMVAEP